MSYNLGLIMPAKSKSAKGTTGTDNSALQVLDVMGHRLVTAVSKDHDNAVTEELAYRLVSIHRPNECATYHDARGISWVVLASLYCKNKITLCIIGLLNNGDFETAPAGGFASAAVGEAATSVPGWTINGMVELISSGQHQGSMILIVPQGEHAVRLGNDAEIAQNVELEKGSEYAVTFSSARTCAQLETLNVSVNGASQMVDLQTLYSIEGWDAYAWAFQAAVDEGRLAFKNTGMEDDPTCGPIIDNVAIKKLFTPDRPKDNQVLNGDFEEGPWMFSNATLGVLLPTNLDEATSTVPGWTVEDNRAVRYIDADHFAVPQGKRAIELLSGREGIISQMVETTPEKQYNLTFLLGAAGDSCQAPMAVTAFAGDHSEIFHYSPTGNATHQPANVTFTAHAMRTRIAFYSVYYNTRSDDRSSLCGPVIDDVRVWEATGSNGARVRVTGPAHIFLALLVAIALIVAQ